ncbi:MAG: hypothetical protein HY936_09035 [Nitrosomonadales bacterium]|nr:hypothetical protein [Nitrosomonadales bacterium]
MTKSNDRASSLATKADLSELKAELIKGASKNSDFAQMQGAGKISQRRICMICKQEIFSATQQLG